jgi:hypothetical protein
LAGETEVFGKKCAPVPLFHQRKCHMDSFGIEFSGEKSVNNRLSCGTSVTIFSTDGMPLQTTKIVYFLNFLRRVMADVRIFEVGAKLTRFSLGS